LSPFQIPLDGRTTLGDRRGHLHEELLLAKKSIDVLVNTSPAWVKTVCQNFDAFLLDHANCERKASAMALSLVVKYPDRSSLIPDLIDLAREEIEHFKEVYDVCAARGLTLQKDEPDPYVKKLLEAARHGRDERLIDRMLIASVIECRGAERFGLLASELEDETMRAFYERLWKAELKHGHLFVHLLLKEFDEELVYPRLQELLELEARIVAGLQYRAALH
jgi:tRNA-(ms[2]io[6]A)-hydroxylase